MTGLIQTALLIGMIVIVEFLMRRKVHHATNPPKPKHADRPSAVTHEVDRAEKMYGV